ncbi:MAG TPA: hypothetical protein VGV89_01290 [Thermoplasmata archaeon]|nr:hypothetical protein [Thermoplasmata archaeon]
MERPHHVCSWTGVTGEDDREITCGRPAQYSITGADGQRLFACAEHLGEVHARLPGGQVAHDALHIDDEGRTKVSPGSAVNWE